MGGVSRVAPWRTSGQACRPKSAAPASIVARPSCGRLRSTPRPGRHGKREDEDERHGVARHRPAVEKPERQEGRNQNEEEIDGSPRGAARGGDQPDDGEDENEERAPPGEEVPHDEGVEERSERSRRERVRPELRPLAEGVEEPRNAPCLAEEPEPPGKRSHEPRHDERFGGRPSPSISPEAYGFEKQERPEDEDEVRADPRSRRGGQSRDEGRQPGPAPVVHPPGRSRERRQGGQEERRRGGVGEGPATVHPDDRKKCREHRPPERRPRADEPPAPEEERDQRNAREQGRGHGQCEERRRNDGEERPADQDPDREPRRLRGEVVQVEARDGPGEDRLVDLPRRDGDRQEARRDDGAQERRHDEERRLARAGLG